MRHTVQTLRQAIIGLLAVCLVIPTTSTLVAQSETGKVLSRKYDFEEAGKEMGYSLYVPNSYSKEKKFPLIVALHGLGSNPRQIMGYPGFMDHAEENGYVVVAPTGYNSHGWYGSRGSGGGYDSDPKNLGELSEKDVMNVLGIIRKEFNIDDERIYLLGHSMGGAGTWHLAIKNPDIWAALAPIAPAGPGSTGELEKARHIPVIVVQGDKDRLVKGTRRWVEKMKELKMEHQYIEIAGGGHVKVAWEHFPEIFEFFNTHSKTANSNSESSEANSETAKDSIDEKIKVLVVTGFDVASHQWQESTRLVEAILAKTGRFDVVISDDKEVFASENLDDHQVIVLSYGFWKETDPSEKAKAGLIEYVKSGGNLVALHFACSSFQDWDEYARLLGRVWEKGVGGHGPYGEFTVNIKNANHPITEGLEDFKTEDELYAKLSGDVQIKVLASAYSDWSKQEEPIVFVKKYGKGRIVHNVLGHALDSKANPSYQKLLCRGVEWAATGAVKSD